MRVVPTAIPGLLLLDPVVHADTRGFLIESFHQQRFDAAVGRHVEFVQDNQSRSVRGVLRGLHYQLPPHAQGKLVQVTAGRVFDVAVDLRRTSPTFGRWVGHELSGENHHLLWLPPGLAHGFLVLSEHADFHYKMTDYYAPAAERCVRHDDPTLAIAWPSAGVAPVVSAKDAAGLAFADAPLFD